MSKKRGRTSNDHLRGRRLHDLLDLLGMVLERGAGFICVGRAAGQARGSP
jgi:hypothetical protein